MATTAIPAPRRPPAITGAAVAAAPPVDDPVFAALCTSLVTVLTTLPAAFVAYEESISDVEAATLRSIYTSVTRLPPTEVTRVPSDSASEVMVDTTEPPSFVTTYRMMLIQVS
jgi:hypothetical protein